jgi:translation initiation factor 5A
MLDQNEQVQFVQMSTLRIGSHIVIDDGACVILDICTSKTGKHGAAKSHVYARNIFTDKKIETIHSTTEMVTIPIVTKLSYMLTNIDDDDIVVMNNKSEELHDVAKLDKSDVCAKLRRLFNEGKVVIVTVVHALGLSRIVDCMEEISK